MQYGILRGQVLKYHFSSSPSIFLIKIGTPSLSNLKVKNYLSKKIECVVLIYSKV